MTMAAMCLGIPGQVVDDVLMGKVDFGGVFKRVCLEHVPQVRLKDYVIVHVGFALSVVDEEEAKQVFAFLERMNELDELEAEEHGSQRSEVGGRKSETLNPETSS